MLLSFTLLGQCSTTGIYCACITDCRVQKSSKDKSQSVERSEHVKEVHTRQSDSQDQLKNDHGEYAECFTYMKTCI